jgi:type II secretory pathway predicted ATPase ExeA
MMMMELRNIFHFTHPPFTREIPTDQLLPFPFFTEAQDAIVHALQNRMSCAIVAPAGAGKTVLMRSIQSLLPEARYRTHYVKVVDLSKRDLCREIAATCGLRPAGSYPELVRRFQEHCETLCCSQALRPCLMLDEAQSMRPDVIGMVTTLTNFDFDSKLVLSVLLAGKLSLKKLLMTEEQEAVRGRLHHFATLRLLSRDEVFQYIAHRCTIAGAPNVPFDEAAQQAIFEIARGNLRCTDELGLKSLEIAARSDHKVVSAQHVVLARRDLWQ